MDRQVITVDIAPGSNAQQRLLVSQGDIGRPLGVRIIQNGLPLNCTGYTAHLYVLKPDHNYYECTCTISNNNLISWDTAEQETPVAGECLAEIRITSGTNDIGTACFVEYVEASPADLGYASESLVSSMTEFVDAAQRAAEEATQAVADVDNVNDVAVDASGHIVLTKVLGSTVESDETVLQPGDIENDLLATTAGKVLDATQGKALKDAIDGLGVDYLTLINLQSLTSDFVTSNTYSGRSFTSSVFLVFNAIHKGWVKETQIVPYATFKQNTGVELRCFVGQTPIEVDVKYVSDTSYQAKYIGTLPDSNPFYVSCWAITLA